MVLDRVEPQRNGPVVAEALGRLMSDPTELGQLAGAAQRIGTTNAATTVAQELLNLAGEQTTERRGECV